MNSSLQPFSCEGSTLSNEYWSKCWVDGNAYWTVSMSHPYYALIFWNNLNNLTYLNRSILLDRLLLKYYDRLRPEVGSKLKFFLPLCGQSLDLKWYQSSYSLNFRANSHWRDDIAPNFYYAKCHYAKTTFCQMPLPQMNSAKCIWFSQMISVYTRTYE